MPRIALYSHDTMGLGHVRRNLALAEGIVARQPGSSVLLISGTHLGGAFRMPAGVDCITLPALGKHNSTGAYSARHLGCPIDHIVGLRAQTIRAALERFDPHMLVVDNVALGALGELEPTLAALRMTKRTRTVLGLRDILDEPAAIEREWAAAGHHASIERYYDQVWIYGDPFVHDLPAACAFPESTRSRVRYVGYLDRRTSADATDLRVLSEIQHPYTVCLAGGGQDGAELALAFAEAIFPAGEEAVLLTGPFAPPLVRERTRHLASARSELHLVEFTEDGATLVEHAARVIGMAGYNSVCEILAYRKPALLVPRETPRLEQTIRARRFAELGLVDMLPLSRLTAEALTAWIAHDRPAPGPSAIQFTALDQVSRLIAGLLQTDAAPDLPPMRPARAAVTVGVRVH